MDPRQTKCFAKAQTELQELFREISSQGHVGWIELQTALLPFTAGDARNDVLELVEDMKLKQTMLNEQEFIRVMWKKMYYGNVMYTSKYRESKYKAGTGYGAVEDGDAVFNIPLAHVIVSIKRRSQLKQFAEYYASRGISGADHLTAEATGGEARAHIETSPTRRRSPRHAHSPRHLRRRRKACMLDKSIAASISSLRELTSSAYDVVACVFDPEERTMRPLTLFSRGVREVSIVNCSRLYCLLFSKNTGNYLLGSSHFAQQVHHAFLQDQQRRKSASHLAPCTVNAASDLPSSIAQRDDILIMHKLEDLGLRNVVTSTSGCGTFVACTERKVHQWTEPQPNSYPPISSMLEINQLFAQEDEAALDFKDPRTAALSPAVNLDEEGDCVGLLGGKKLLARAKIIADVASIKQIVAGNDFAMAITTAGETFTWGLSLLGQGQLSPSKLPWTSTEKAMRIACGLNHVLVATKTGAAYSWGSNLYGQLGHSKSCSLTDPPVREPTAIRLSGLASTASRTFSVLDVACGDDHSVLLADSGDVYCFGNNWQGQLGLRPEITETGCVYEPMRVELVPDKDPSSEAIENNKQTQGPDARAYLISAYGSTTAAVTTRGDVFVWGQCVATGPESVCGLVSRWEPQRLDLSPLEEDSKGAHAVYQSIAIANGLVVLTTHKDE